MNEAKVMTPEAKAAFNAYMREWRKKRKQEGGKQDCYERQRFC